MSYTSLVLKHEALKAVLADRIATGELRPGQRIPSLRQLAKIHGASLAPIRRAVGELLSEGVITSIPGRQGLFVTPSSTPSVKSKHNVIAMAYEGEQYHSTELENTRLVSQLWCEELIKETSRRGLWSQSVLYKPVELNTAAENEQLLDKLTQYRVLVFVDDSYRHWCRYLESHGCYVIFISSFPWPGTNYVVWDIQAAMRHLVEYLVGLGHRRIGYFGMFNREVGITKLNSYLCTLRQHNCDWNQRIVVNMNGISALDGYLATQKLLRELRPEEMPTAFVADTDYRAIGVIAALREAGLRVPEDVSVAGMDNRFEAAGCTPPLTTVGADWSTMASVAIDTVERVVRENQAEVVRKVVPFKLVIRGSTAEPKMDVK